MSKSEEVWLVNICNNVAWHPNPTTGLYVISTHGVLIYGAAFFNHESREDFLIQIAQHKVVTLNSTLKDNDGTLIDESHDSSFVYLHGANNIVTGLEDSLNGKLFGDKMNVSIAPEEAYGVRDQSRIESVLREMFPDDTEIEQGMQFHAEGPSEQFIMVTVIGVEENKVTIDGNHPLAGVELNFDVEVMDVRDATAE